MDATLSLNKNQFTTIVDLYKFINTLKIEISSIININHISIICMPIKEVNNEFNV